MVTTITNPISSTIAPSGSTALTRVGRVVIRGSALGALTPVAAKVSDQSPDHCQTHFLSGLVSDAVSAGRGQARVSSSDGRVVLA
jgi:hypothetical protein